MRGNNASIYIYIYIFFFFFFFLAVGGKLYEHDNERFDFIKAGTITTSYVPFQEELVCVFSVSHVLQ
jgi:hypothetical protein